MQAYDFGECLNELSKEDTKSSPKNETKTKWSHLLCGEVEIAEICFNSVESLCPKENSGCDRLHSTNYYHWQVKEQDGGSWMNLPLEQSKALEINYCDPSVVSFQLPPLGVSALSNDFISLKHAMKGRSKWKVDFESLSLILESNDTQKMFLKLRRLAVEKVQHKNLPANQFSWYFLDINGIWIEYGKKDSTGKHDACSSTSLAIEQSYQQDCSGIISISNSKYKYKLDFRKMIQKNYSTTTERPMRRRPFPHLRKNSDDSSTSVNLPPTWTLMGMDDEWFKVTLSASSTEYQNLVALVKQRGGASINIIRIQRIQNKFLYYPYINKMKQLKTVYKNEKQLNIQQLFHGTRPNVVEEICEQNFDWRLHGSNSGQNFGRGTYFAMSPSYSYNYATVDNDGLKYIFIAKVIVGSLVIGNSSMVRPPKNPSTNALYESSCDNITTPTIIVKYDKQEYYPEYILVVK